MNLVSPLYSSALAELKKNIHQHDFDYCYDMLAIVSITDQRLYFLSEGRLQESYPVSTASRGSGNRINSFKTPLGLFEIVEKYGDNASLGTVFKGREPTGEIAAILKDPNDETESDLITSRILRLSGLQSGWNRGGDVDTFSRYIYIHGTPEENRIGRPASQGCIRMRNKDVAELYECLPLNSVVYIDVNPWETELRPEAQT